MTSHRAGGGHRTREPPGVSKGADVVNWVETTERGHTRVTWARAVWYHGPDTDSWWYDDDDVVL